MYLLPARSTCYCLVALVENYLTKNTIGERYLVNSRKIHNGIMAGKAPSRGPNLNSKVVWYPMVRTTPTPIQKQIHETETETMADLDPTLMNIMVVVVVDAGNHTPTT
jgi:hypothetical protein